MGRRIDLHNELKQICSNVYFQPPENLSISYPCIVYRRDGITPRHADDHPYVLDCRYTIVYVSQSPDDDAVFLLARLPRCSAKSFYTSDNLYHYPFTIIY